MKTPRKVRKKIARQLTIDFDRATGTLSLSGVLGIHQLARAQRSFERWQEESLRAIDLIGLTRLDTTGAMLIKQWAGDVPIHAGEKQQEILHAIGAPPPEPPMPPPRLPLAEEQLIDLGRWAGRMHAQAVELLTFMGHSAVMLARAVAQPKHLRWPSVAQYIEQVGIQALPIIGLMAFLIAIVLAYQGIAQLRPYGGETFTVNLVAISIFREMGVLLTAIMVAGRSGSAFTAEIGVMKSREEIDALKVMGFDAFDLLVVPRLVAIMIALPLLTFFADMMGLFGGFLIIHSLIGITLGQYIDRVHLAAHGHDLIVGLIKAPVFAFFIGVVGCMHGLKVSGSAESIGTETTASVVKAIFLVLVLDAFFSILFEMLKL